MIDFHITKHPPAAIKQNKLASIRAFVEPSLFKTYIIAINTKNHGNAVLTITAKSLIVTIYTSFLQSDSWFQMLNDDLLRSSWQF